MIHYRTAPTFTTWKINSFVTTKFTISPQSNPIFSPAPRTISPPPPRRAGPDVQSRPKRPHRRPQISRHNKQGRTSVACHISLSDVNRSRSEASSPRLPERWNGGSITPGRRNGGTPPQCDSPSPRRLEIVSLARRGHEIENGNRPFRMGGVGRSEGSNVGCSHSAGCPLFPLLRANLQGWRDYYCDSQDQWLGCARYQMSLTGERVPISLLPNGAHARHLENPGDAGRSRAADPRQVPRQAPPPQHNPWSQGSASGSQPAPARPPEPSGHGIAAPGSAAQWGAASPQTQGTHYHPSAPPQNPQPHTQPSQHAPQAPSQKRGWWARFTEWMGGPA